MNNESLNIFAGAPSIEEIKSYLLRKKRLADLKHLESSPERESSEELSESFEMYLQQRKNKVEEERQKIMSGNFDSPRSSKVEPLRQSDFNDTTLCAASTRYTMNQCTDDSFLEMEKLCERTLHLNNVSSCLVDLTTLDMNVTEPLKELKFPAMSDETHLFSVEAPSFMFNNSMVSPNKHSPLIAVHTNRPSTILEVSEAGSSNRTCMSSYKTALARSEIDTSEVFKTADEESFPRNETIDDNLMIIKMPKIRSFYETIDITKDSLESTAKTQVVDMTKDSLETESYLVESSGANSSSGVDSSYDDRNDDECEEPMNDTLEQIEFILAQAQKMQQTPKVQQTPKFIPSTPTVSPPSPMTPCHMKQSARPKAFTNAVSASKISPMIKFSPAARNNSPMTFKKPVQSASKVPLTSSTKKYQHIESPISRYIKHTPGLPLQSTARVLPGVSSSPKQFNFRDSESFANENMSLNSKYQGPSLPQRAKTKSSAVSHVFDQRESKKIPGGEKMLQMLGTSPSVVVHQGHVKTQDRFKLFQNNKFNETALSEQSFADLTLMSGDVSVQVVEKVKRTWEK